ncbi:MAG: phytoene/squalene synthase family protein [Betaproteobacteria bacterium]|nr:phytoene/squalene synthase family protein [Betaproteobacteria bacterium]
MPMRDESLASSDLASCIAMMQGGSKTFFAASRLLPPRIRYQAIALYAFCRVADDCVDHAGAHDEPLEHLNARLDAIYAGAPLDHVEDHALSMVVAQVGLPRHLLQALIEGFAWDAEGRRYERLEDVLDYSARVAGSVGAMMCWIMGPRDAPTLERACELGLAMQLTNIARDVGEDARMGRLYLPRQWMRASGLDPDVWLQQPSFNGALSSVIARLLGEAERLYEKAKPGIAKLPPDCRAAIYSASLIYSEIGHQLKREGLNSVDHRTVVSASRKLKLLLAAWTQAAWIRMSERDPEPEQAIEDMVRECVSGHSATSAASSQAVYFPSRSAAQRVAWVLDLLERREHQKRDRAISAVAG